MVRALSALVLLVAVVPASAKAARTWQEPVPVAEPAPRYATAAVGRDGTTVSAWTVDEGLPGGFSVYAAVAGGTPQLLGTTGAERVAVAAGAAGQAIVAWAVETTGQALAALATPARAFAPPVTLGEGVPFAVEMNAAGDAAALLQRTLTTFNDPIIPGFAFRNTLAFRPAGSAFGPPADLPDTLVQGFALSPTGETLVGLSRNVQDGPAAGLAVYARVRDGAVTGPVELTTDGTNASLHLDAAGRALATWQDPRSVPQFAVRSADGKWGAPAAVPGAPRVFTYSAAVSETGDALIAWRRPLPTGLEYTGVDAALEVATGSIVDGAFTTATVDAEPGTAPVVAVAPDGSALLASGRPAADAVVVARREGTGAFGAVRIAACDRGGRFRDIALLDAEADATLLVGSMLVRDLPSAFDGPDPACPATEPETAISVAYSDDPVLAGRSTTITASVRRAGHAAPTRYRFDLDGDGTVDSRSAGPAVTHTFPAPGLARFTVSSDQPQPYDRPRDVYTDAFTVDVHARAKLIAAKRLRHRTVVRRGITVRANAFTGATPKRVRLVLKSANRLLVRRVVELGATPTPVRLRVRPGRRDRLGRRVTIALRQNAAELARAHVRIERAEDRRGPMSQYPSR